jgi:hypothetical protein
MQHPLWWEDGSVVYNCCRSSPAQSFSCPSPEVFMIFYCLRFETPQPGEPGPSLYIPQEQCGPVIAPGIGFRFRRLLRLAGLRWRFSTPPQQGILKRPWPDLRNYTNICTDLREITKSSSGRVPRVPKLALGTSGLQLESVNVWAWRRGASRTKLRTNPAFLSSSVCTQGLILTKHN